MKWKSGSTRNRQYGCCKLVPRLLDRRESRVFIILLLSVRKAVDMDPELVKFASVGSRYIAGPTIGDDQIPTDFFL